MKGIVLAGGMASRLAPTTFVVNKHILPIYNKPMIYYALSTLMLIGIRDILITSGTNDLPLFKQLLGDGSQLGISVKYAAQENAGGIAEVLLVAEDFLAGSERFAMILGDNIFYIPHIRRNLQNLFNITRGAGILLSNVCDPCRFGIAGFDNSGNIVTVEEKPEKPKSNWAITGLYFYDQLAIKFAKDASRSARGELEITTINECYLKHDMLYYSKMPRGSIWLDTGTPKSMFDASEFIKIIDERQQTKIAVLEEVAYNMGYISKEELLQSASKFKKGCEYREYIIECYNDTNTAILNL